MPDDTARCVAHLRPQPRSVAALPAALAAWGSDAFAAALKREIEALGPDVLPLQRATTRGGLVDAAGFEVTVISTSDDAGPLQARLGVFFQELIGGCSCGEEPVAASAYCELQLEIDRSSAAAAFSVL
jgi:hypothetical protein